VSFVSIFWYNLNGFLNVKKGLTIYFFPAKKAPDEPQPGSGGKAVGIYGFSGGKKYQLF
jgi:hypothetical protein